MKKLIAIAAVALAAISAQASCAAWKYSCSVVNEDLVGSSVYVVLGTYSTAPAFESLEALQTAAYNKTGIATTTATKPKWKNSASGTIDSESLTSATPNFYLVFVNSAEDKFFVGSVQDATSALYEAGSSASTTVSFAPTTTSFATFTAAPEPTSGLLLLLGVAGLALKRKRA